MLYPYRLVAKVIEHEVFPSPVLKARIGEKRQWKSKRTKATRVDAIDGSVVEQSNCHPL